MSGGWAIDLFLGEVTREHEDLEVTIFRQHQHELREHYADWEAFAVLEAGRWDPWRAGDYLDLPVHQVLFRAPGSPDPNPWEPSYELDRQFFLNDVEGGVWISRRDPRVRLHVRQLAQRSTGGVPIVAPEVQLLYKARHGDKKNEHDFGLVAPLLGSTRRKWLREALELVHPGHQWIQALA